MLIFIVTERLWFMKALLLEFLNNSRNNSLIWMRALELDVWIKYVCYKLSRFLECLLLLKSNRYTNDVT